MTESCFNNVWQHQMLDKSLVSVDGQSVVVFRAGNLNRDAGPDFFNARISVGGVEWAGNIEIHRRTSDWNAHHHSDDKAYNNVILHVVYEHDADISLQNGTHPATLELRRFLHPALVANYDALMTPVTDDIVPCVKRLPSVPSFVLNSYLERLTVERIEAKADVVRRLLDESRGGWEQTCYWLLSHYFGGKVNALPFEFLAKATSLNFLSRWKDNPRRIEALLMGQAGLLEGDFEDEYPRQLQSDYEALRSGAVLHPVDSHLWRFFRIRPSAFPTIRISQLANLVASSPSLFSSLLAMTDVTDIQRLLNCHASPYWDCHYHFDRPSARSSVKRLGRMQTDLLIINACVPLLFVYGETMGSQQYKDRAVSLLQQLGAENNRIVRQWQEAGLVPDNAAQSQALIHLKSNYCDSRRCLDCRIGHNIIKQIS